MLLEFAIQLAKLIVSTIKWAEGNQFGRIWGEVGGVLLVLGLGKAVFELI